MFNKYLSRLENRHHPLLGPNILGLKICGLWQPHGTNYFYNLLHTIFVLFILSQYMECWAIRSDVTMALRNISVTLQMTVCAVKVWTFIFWQKSWKELVEYVSNLEYSQLSKRDEVTDGVIAEYTKYSRRITYFFWCLIMVSGVIKILAPLAVFLSSSERDLILNGTLPYPEILSSWMPFDRSKGLGYWATLLVHIWACCHAGGIVANYDSSAVVIMKFFAGQLKLLSLNCARLCGDGNEIVDANEAMKRIKDCHYQHINLVKFARILNSLLSPVMFLYVIISSFMMCSCVIEINTEGTTNMQRIWIVQYFIALVSQLFLYCWHSDDVLYRSNKVDDGVYATAWWTSNVRMRKSIALLGGQLRRPIIFTAGPFTQLTISTFITILKGAYSYYTVLSNKKN